MVEISLASFISINRVEFGESAPVLVRDQRRFEPGGCDAPRAPWGGNAGTRRRRSSRCDP